MDCFRPMDHRPVRRAVLVSALAALVVAGCGTSQGAQVPTAGTLAGIGVTPDQLGDPQGAALPTEPPRTTSAVTQPDLPPLTDPRVFMVGDSVLLATTQGRPDALDTYVGSLGWQITVDARVSRFTDEGIRVLRKRRGEVHEVAVVLLGNNYGGNELQFAAQVDEILQMLDGVRVIVMLTVPVYDQKQNEVNDILRQAAATDSRIVLVDWEAYTRLDPSVLSGDDVHPTSYGADVIAQLIGLNLGHAPGGDPNAPLPVLGSRTRPPVSSSADKGESRPSEGAGRGVGSGAAPTAAPRPRPTTPTTAAPVPATTKPTPPPATTSPPPATSSAPPTSAAPPTNPTHPDPPDPTDPPAQTNPPPATAAAPPST